MTLPEVTALHVLVVDDELLARSRLRTLLAQGDGPKAMVSGEAADAVSAHQLLAEQRFDVVLLDIHMPGEDGLDIARALQHLPQAPAVVFVTAHESYAVVAFDLEAVDYLTKPVRLERLQQALQKAERWLRERRAPSPHAPLETLLIQDRAKSERVPLSEVLYLKSELKYLTVRTATRSYIFDGVLNELEERYATTFVRVHRNALVARVAIRTLEKYDDGEDTEGWQLQLAGIPEPIAVSRRQLGAVREALRTSRDTP
jgi:two-component system response regulator AlgR